jgi:hypothetical protein
MKHNFSPIYPSYTGNLKKINQEYLSEKILMIPSPINGFWMKKCVPRFDPHQLFLLIFKYL